MVTVHEKLVVGLKSHNDSRKNHHINSQRSSNARKKSELRIEKQDLGEQGLKAVGRKACRSSG